MYFIIIFIVFAIRSDLMWFILFIETLLVFFTLTRLYFLFLVPYVLTKKGYAPWSYKYYIGTLVVRVASIMILYFFYTHYLGWEVWDLFIRVTGWGFSHMEHGVVLFLVKSCGKLAFVYYFYGPDFFGYDTRAHSFWTYYFYFLSGQIMAFILPICLLYFYTGGLGRDVVFMLLFIVLILALIKHWLFDLNAKLWALGQ